MTTLIILVIILAFTRLRVDGTPDGSTASARLFFFAFLIVIVILIAVVARSMKKR